MLTLELKWPRLFFLGSFSFEILHEDFKFPQEKQLWAFEKLLYYPCSHVNRSAWLKSPSILSVFGPKLRQSTFANGPLTHLLSHAPSTWCLGYMFYLYLPVSCS